MENREKKLSDALWQIYRRPERPSTWQIHDGNLPWDDPEFSERMLREHLDESHNAATRKTAARLSTIDWLWDKLDLTEESKLLDVTCGPGLYAVEFAKRGCIVNGYDFAPASIAYAKELAIAYKVTETCRFTQQDVREMILEPHSFDGAILLYGQLTVFQTAETKAILANMAQALKPGGKLCIELLNQEKIDKKKSNWWFTDNTGLWGDAPFLHFGERFWLVEEKTAVDRFYTLHLETGELETVELCDKSYSQEEVVALLQDAGFTAVSVYPAWDDLPFYDGDEWITYVAEK